jgi:outer membrane protein assembly factor BamB
MFVRLALVLTLGFGQIPQARSADWPQWRGPKGDGISPETDLAQSWPKNGPKVLWKEPLGGGYAQVVVAQGRLFVHTARNKKEEIVRCLDPATGKELWHHTYPCDYDRHPTLNGRYDSGPRATPAARDGRVFTVGTTGIVLCLDAATGKKIWQADLLKIAQARCPKFGHCSSPLIVGPLLFVHPGGTKGNSVAALHAQDGTLAWQALDDAIACASPIHFDHQDSPQVVYFTGAGAVGLAPQSGKVLWRYPWESGFEPHCSTPIHAHGKVFVSSTHGLGGAVFQLNPAGVPKTVWKSAVMENQFSTSVLTEGHLYGFSGKRLRCVNFATGKKHWDHKGLGRGTLIAADGKLIVLGEYGELVLADADPNAYVEKGRCQSLEGECVTAPALADGRLFVRNERTLVALDLKQPGP